jgi:hypothetical protein
MQATYKVMLGLVVGCAMVLAVQAEEKDKKVTLKGEITCTKCGLSETKACGNAIQVKEDGKTVTYYFNDKGKASPYHGKICTAPKNGSVTGVVSEKDKKKFITPDKDGVKFD